MPEEAVSETPVEEVEEDEEEEEVLAVVKPKKWDEFLDE